MNVFIFSAAANMIGKGVKVKEPVYYPVSLIDIPEEDKPEAPPPPAPPKPPPPVEKVIGLDETKPPEPEPEKPPEPIEVARDTVPAPPGPPAPPAPRKEYRPFHRLSRLPDFVERVMPEYPPSERAAGREARVTVEVYISEDGRVDDVKLVKGAGPLFDRAVMDAVRKSTFSPGYAEQEPVAVKIIIPYVFKLK